MKTIGVLTSSRADYGILRPLLIRFNQAEEFNLHVYVFGTHLSIQYDQTIKEIEKDGLFITQKVDTLPSGDKPQDIVQSISLTSSLFANIFSRDQEKLDLLICLGDRYEMLAAVLSAAHFNIPIAHLHGGETTMGAMDNRYRHMISLCSSLHFCATEIFKERLVQLLDEKQNIYNVGALGLDNLIDFTPTDKEHLQAKFNIDFMLPTLLVVYHPETEKYEGNTFKLNELLKALEVLRKEFQIIINMPNADITGLSAKGTIKKFVDKYENVHGIEHFGSQAYFSAIYYSKALIGNSSSGIIEAASLNTYVLNLGDRQKGRVQSHNIINAQFDSVQIIKKTREILSLPYYSGNNLYQNKNGSTSSHIFGFIKSYLND